MERSSFKAAPPNYWVMLAAGIYVQWKSLLEKYMEGFSEEDIEKVFGQNAIGLYNL